MTRHVGCGIKDPFARTWMIYAACWAAAGLSFVLTVTLRTWWGELGWLLLPVLLGPSIWWEIVHSPGKMYRTWWP